MTYYTSKLEALRPLAEASEDYQRARKLFERDPTQEHFNAVVEWVAQLASPSDDEPELDGHFQHSWSSVVVCDFAYTALTEGLLETSGYLMRDIYQTTDQRRQDWLRSRHVLWRSGFRAQ